MDKSTKCGFCHWFFRSKVNRRNGTSDISRTCKKTKKIITPESTSCKRFVPSYAFWCDVNEHWITIPQCLQRRYNAKEFEGWDGCKQCRRWDNGLQEVVEEYVFGMAKKKLLLRREEPDPPRKIKRRKKPEKRKIRRRDKKKRIIKRR